MNNKTRRTPGRPSRHAAPVDTEKVLAHAWQVFSGTSYDKASLRTVADKAGVSASLLSYLYGSKEALWHEAVRSVMDPLHQQYMDELDLLVTLPQTGMIEVRQLLALCIDRALEEPVPSTFLYREAEGTGKRAQFLRTNYMQPYLLKVYEVYRAACANSHLPAMDSATFLTLLMSVVRFVFLPGLLTLLLPENQQTETNLRQLLLSILDQLLPVPSNNNSPTIIRD